MWSAGNIEHFDQEAQARKIRRTEASRQEWLESWREELRKKIMADDNVNWKLHMINGYRKRAKYAEQVRDEAIEDLKAAEYNDKVVDFLQTALDDKNVLLSQHETEVKRLNTELADARNKLALVVADREGGCR